MQARARALADGEESRQAGAPVGVGDDAAHQVVRRGRDRDELAGGLDARVAERVDDVREAPRDHHSHVEPDR